MRAARGMLLAGALAMGLFPAVLHAQAGPSKAHHWLTSLMLDWLGLRFGIMLVLTGQN